MSSRVGLPQQLRTKLWSGLIWITFVEQITIIGQSDPADHRIVKVVSVIVSVAPVVSVRVKNTVSTGTAGLATCRRVLQMQAIGRRESKGVPIGRAALESQWVLPQVEGSLWVDVKADIREAEEERIGQAAVAAEDQDQKNGGSQEKIVDGNAEVKREQALRRMNVRSDQDGDNRGGIRRPCLGMHGGKENQSLHTPIYFTNCYNKTTSFKFGLCSHEQQPFKRASAFLNQRPKLPPPKKRLEDHVIRQESIILRSFLFLCLYTFASNHAGTLLHRKEKNLYLAS